MPLDFPSEGQGCNDTIFDMKSRPRSLTTATAGAASTCHELQAWQFWGVLRSLILSPWTQKTLIWTEVPWAAHVKAFAMISRILNRVQGIWRLRPVPAQGTLGALASSGVPLLRYWKTHWVHQNTVKSGKLSLKVSSPSHLPATKGLREFKSERLKYQCAQ